MTDRKTCIWNYDSISTSEKIVIAHQIVLWYISHIHVVFIKRVSIQGIFPHFSRPFNDLRLQRKLPRKMLKRAFLSLWISNLLVGEGGGGMLSAHPLQSVHPLLHPLQWPRPRPWNWTNLFFFWGKNNLWTRDKTCLQMTSEPYNAQRQKCMVQVGSKVL